MNEVLAVQRVKKVNSGLERRVSNDFIAPFDRPHDLCSLLTVEHCRSFLPLNLFITVRSDNERVNNSTRLPNGVKVPRVTQIKAPVNISSFLNVLRCNFL